MSNLKKQGDTNITTDLQRGADRRTATMTKRIFFLSTTITISGCIPLKAVKMCNIKQIVQVSVDMLARNPTLGQHQL